jgi:putative intracellular protease/amidase
MVSQKFKALLLLLAFVGVLAGAGFSAPVEAQTTVDALILVTDGFGWTYFDAVDLLTSWGVDVTVIADSGDTAISSCLNRPPRPITADLLLSTFNMNTLSNYDCLFIPSGGHWQALSLNQAVRDFVAAAFAEGLVVASLCIGNMVIARSNGIVDGCKVVSYSQSNVAMQQAGATIVSGVEVVSDHRIVTGATGGGFPDGYTSAPTYEVCVAMVKAALNLSYVRSSTLEPMPDGTGFTITVETQDPASYLIGIPSNEITSVTVELCFTANPSEPVVTRQLIDPDYDGTYSESIIGLAPGAYQINIEVEDSNATVEIVPNAAASSLAPSLSPLVLGGAIACVVIVSSVFALLLWRRQKRK